MRRLAAHMLIAVGAAVAAPAGATSPEGSGATGTMSYPRVAADEVVPQAAKLIQALEEAVG